MYCISVCKYLGFLVAQLVQFLGQDDPLEKG